MYCICNHRRTRYLGEWVSNRLPRHFRGWLREDVRRFHLQRSVTLALYAQGQLATRRQVFLLGHARDMCVATTGTRDDVAWRVALKYCYEQSGLLLRTRCERENRAGHLCGGILSADLKLPNTFDREKWRTEPPEVRLVCSSKKCNYSEPAVPNGRNEWMAQELKTLLIESNGYGGVYSGYSDSDGRVQAITQDM